MEGTWVLLSIKKYKKSNAIGFEGVSLNIKIGVFDRQKTQMLRVGEYADWW